MSEHQIQDTDYVFLSAMIRAREVGMLTREKIERMLTEPTFEGAARIISECGYPDVSQMNSAQIDEVLAKRRTAELADLAGLVPERELIDIFRLKYEYHSAKVLIKAGSRPDVFRLITDTGRVELEDLVHAYESNDFSSLPGLLGTAMESAKQALSRSGNPQLADFIMDKAYFEEMTDMASRISGNFVSGYVELLIDGTNLRSVIRAKRMGKGSDLLENVLAPGGSIPVSAILASSDNADSISSLFSVTELADAAQMASDAIAGHGLTAFERAVDNAINAYLSNAALISFGSGPVAAYIAAVENEAVTIRTILNGRLMGVGTEQLRERLRDSYV